MSRENYEFVGGEQDGRVLDVPGPVRSEMEFLVRPEEPYRPWESYRLGDDGRFHYVGLVLDDVREPAAVG